MNTKNISTDLVEMFYFSVKFNTGWGFGVFSFSFAKRYRCFLNFAVKLYHFFNTVDK